jgi:hypothetical protein
VATVISLPGNATAGTVVTATITFANNGTSTAANVTGSAVIGTSGGTITTTGVIAIGSLPPGSSTTVLVTFTGPALGPVNGTATGRGWRKFPGVTTPTSTLPTWTCAGRRRRGSTTRPPTATRTA